MHDLLPVIVAGIVSGASYALLARGIVIIYRSTHTVNFAIGDIATLSVFVSLTLVRMGLPAPLALLPAIVIAGALGVAVERVFIRPLGHGHDTLFVALVVTIGLGLFIHVLVGAIWGHRSLVVPPIVPGTVQIAGVALTWNKVMATLIALVALVAVAWLFRYTETGAAMRATAEDHFAARLVGIQPSRIAGLAWFLGCGLAGIAAFIIAVDTSLNPNLTISALFRAFAGVFLGGILSMPGAALGGFAIGILDNIAGRYISANFRDTVVFATIVAVLFLKPTGFLGTARSERV